MVKRLNFDVSITDLQGQETGDNIGRVLAHVLAIQVKGDPLKFMTWALSLHKGDSIELDPTDLETLRQFITGNEQLTNLIKYQLLNIINA